MKQHKRDILLSTKGQFMKETNTQIFDKFDEQAGAELCQAQVKLGVIVYIGVQVEVEIEVWYKLYEIMKKSLAELGKAQVSYKLDLVLGRFLDWHIPDLP